jgi:hypothetical protein
MIKLISIWAATFVFLQSVVCQTTSGRDSLVAETYRMSGVVDSLRKEATKESTLNHLLSRKMETLSHREDTATNGLAKLRAAYIRQSAHFNSTLDRLDSCTGLLNKLTDSVQRVFKLKN